MIKMGIVKDEREGKIRCRGTFAWNIFLSLHIPINDLCIIHGFNRASNNQRNLGIQHEWEHVPLGAFSG
jgi:hypothetical protein